MESTIARLAHDARNLLLDAGVNVISDAQHVTRRSCMEEVRQAERHGAVSRIIDCGVELKLDDLIARNETRPIDDQVPVEYLISSWEYHHETAFLPVLPSA